MAERRGGAPAVRGGHRGRPRPPPARARRAAVGVAAADRADDRGRVGRPATRSAWRRSAPRWSGCPWRCRAPVVVVNITRSRRRTTDKPTEEGLLGWSVLQDVTGVALGTVIVAVSGTEGRSLPVALALLAAFGLLAVVAAQVLPFILTPAALGARPVPDRVGRVGPRDRRGRRRVLRGARPRSRRSSPASRSATAPRRPRPVAACCRSATCSPCCSSSPSARSSIPAALPAAVP